MTTDACMSLESGMEDARGRGLIEDDEHKAPSRARETIRQATRQ